MSIVTKQEKLQLLSEFHTLFTSELAKIPKDKIYRQKTAKPEELAKEYYSSKGYEVFSSRIRDGYRSIGAEFYWRGFVGKRVESDLYLLNKLKQILSPEEFLELANTIKTKNGTPDLLLIKDNKISFVEVKHNSEEVKLPTVEFFIKYSDRWQISILRVLTN
jgi:Holliday junction resolvase-like predicted endonuclease